MQNDIRIFFTKTGMAKYISHLDLMRCMTRAFKRSGLPLWFTEGYNPHIFMTFARPLSLGTESLCESVDVRLIEETPLSEVKSRLQAVLPRDIAVVDVAEPKHKPMEIAFADYEIQLFCENAKELLDHIENAYAKETVPVLKKAKQGRKKVEKEIDIKPNIRTFSAKTDENGVHIVTRLTAGDNDNVNPALLLSALTAAFSGEITNTDILKTQVLLQDESEFC